MKSVVAIRLGLIVFDDLKEGLALADSECIDEDGCALRSRAMKW